MIWPSILTNESGSNCVVTQLLCSGRYGGAISSIPSSGQKPAAFCFDSAGLNHLVVIEGSGDLKDEQAVLGPALIRPSPRTLRVASGLAAWGMVLHGMRA